MSRGNRSHERTAQQREADRLERERRRAEREGLSAPTPPSAPTPAPVPDSSVAPGTESEPARLADEPRSSAPAQELEPSAPAQELELIETPAPEPSPTPAPREPQPEEVAPDAVHEQPSSAFDDQTVEHAAADRPPSEREERSEQEEAEEELPPWAVHADEQLPAATAPPAQAHANLVVGQRMREPDGGLTGIGGGGRSRGDAPRGRAPRGPTGRRLTRARGAALVALLAAIALVWFLVSLFQPFAGEGSGKVIVSIPKGSSSSKIGSILAREGVVSSSFFFDTRALLDGKRGSLHSGRFALKHDMSYSAAIAALSKPPPRAIAVKVVIPEGYTRRQIANLVAQDALSGDYLAQTKRSRLLDPAHYGAPAGTPDLEGFLFPATYDLTAGAPVQRLVDDQLAAFRQRFTNADVRRAHALGVTPYQLLTVASMIEREAQTEHDRPLIAAVIYNRLREGIPLGIDATIYYAVEQQENIATYTGELTESQLKSDSPYNTRTHKGLPPTPISNPGEASIDAAAHPAHVHYLYYVAAADGCGEQTFSDTYAQFEKNVTAYQAAVKKNGGHPPKCKKK